MNTYDLLLGKYYINSINCFNSFVYFYTILQKHKTLLELDVIFSLKTYFLYVKSFNLKLIPFTNEKPV